MSARWTIEYLQNGGLDPRQGPGWYVCSQRREASPGRGVICTCAGPFDTKEAAKEWAWSEKVVDCEEKTDVMREAGRRPSREAGDSGKRF